MLKIFKKRNNKIQFDMRLREIHNEYDMRLAQSTLKETGVDHTLRYK